MKSKHFGIFTLFFLVLSFIPLSACNSNKQSIDYNERFEVTFKNYDQSVLYYNTVGYGESAVYQGATPTRPADAEISYVFSGWDKSLNNITRDTVFVAQYETTDTKFSIYWANYDGTIIETTSVGYGEVPVYTGLTPTRQDNEQYTYQFIGWSPKIEEAYNDMTYTAIYEGTIRSYTVTWANYNGTVLEKDFNVQYGDMPEYNGLTPTKPSTTQQTFEFAGWSPKVEPVKGNVTYTATFKDLKQRYTITWLNYDGSVLKVDKNVEYGTTPKYTGTTPTKPSSQQYSYEFSGWSPEIREVTGDATYTAQFKVGKNKYTITWLDYDGSVLKQDTDVEYGETPEYTGTTPTRENSSVYSYVFSGWKPDIQSVTGDATYTATYMQTEISYTISFDLNGGYSPSYKSSIHVKTLSADDFFFDVTKEDYIFRGWSYNGETIFDEKGNQLSIPTMSSSMTFMAVYSQKVKLQIEINLPGAGSVYGSGEYPYNTNVDLNATVNQGYIFNGWYYNNVKLSAENKYTFKTWNADVTIQAKYSYNSYKMTISANDYSLGGVCFNPTSNTVNYFENTYTNIVYKGKATILAYTKTETRFLGWFNENDQLVETNAIYSFIMPNHDYELQAKWNHFVITYNLNGGTNNPSNPIEYKVEDGDIKLYEPTKLGCDFTGWEINGKKVTSIDSKLMKDVLLTATWKNHVYDITYHLDEGTNNSDNPKTFDMDNTINLLEPTKSGYTFDGWYLDAGLTSKIGVISPHTFYQDLDLYAKWTPNKYSITLYDYNNTYGTSHTVSFNSNGGSSVSSQTVSTTVGLNYPTLPTRTGYAFTGWYRDSNCTDLYDFSLPVCSNLTLYAGWAAMESAYNYRYYINPINYNTSSNYYSTSVSGTPSAPNYYYFTGCKNQTMTFYYKNGSSGLTYEKYFEIIDTATNLKVGSGQTSSTTFTSISVKIKAGHAYYISVYNQNTNSSYFHFYFTNYSLPNDGGYVDKNIFNISPVTYDSSYKLNCPSKNGYIFLGWYNGTTKYTDNEGNPIDKWEGLSNLSLTAKWELLSYDITYHLDGGINDESNPEKYTVEDSITLANPTRDGYEFAGWYTDPYFDYSITTISNGNYYQDLDLYAKWTPIVYKATLYVSEFDTHPTYTVSFETNGASEIVNSVTVDESASVKCPTTLTKDGYVFRGWFSDELCTELFDFTKPITSDTTLYAGWTSMVTSYYSRTIIQPENYNSSSYFSASMSSTSSSSCRYYYFTAAKTETVTWYYHTNSTSSSYRIYYKIVNATTGSTVLSNTYMSNSSFYSRNLDLVAGNVYYIAAYRYNTSYSPTLYFYFANYTAPSNSLFTLNAAFIATVDVAYGSNFRFNYTVEREGYKFLGWFDEDGKQYTDADGYSLFAWDHVGDITLYAHWELIE